jgi:hypothetical protein
MGRYTADSTSRFAAKMWLPSYVDLLVVILFSLVIFYWAVSLTMSREKVAEEVAKDAFQIEYEHLTTA